MILALASGKRNRNGSSAFNAEDVRTPGKTPIEKGIAFALSTSSASLRPLHRERSMVFAARPL